MKLHYQALLLFSLTLSACSFEVKWRDTTGQNRTQQQARADVRECQDAAGMASLNKNSTKAELEAFSRKVDSCMTDHGWEIDKR